jgi:hypothetical protein
MSTEVVVAYYTVVYKELFAVTQENHKHYGGESRCLGQDSNRVRPAFQSKPTYSVAPKNVF